MSYEKSLLYNLKRSFAVSSTVSHFKKIITREWSLARNITFSDYKILMWVVLKEARLPACEFLTPVCSRSGRVQI